MVYSVASVSSLLFLFLSEVVDWMMPDPGAVNQIRSVSVKGTPGTVWCSFYPHGGFGL